MRPEQRPATDRRVRIALGTLAAVLTMIGAQHVSHSAPTAPVMFAAAVQPSR